MPRHAPDLHPLPRTRRSTTLVSPLLRDSPRARRLQRTLQISAVRSRRYKASPEHTPVDNDMSTDLHRSHPGIVSRHDLLITPNRKRRQLRRRHPTTTSPHDPQRRMELRPFLFRHPPSRARRRGQILPPAPRRRGVGSRLVRPGGHARVDGAAGRSHLCR